MTQPSPTGPTELNDPVDDLGPAQSIRRFVNDVAEQRPVLRARRHGYVSLRPSGDRAVAVYVHANRVSIACDPLKASSLNLPGRKDPVTPATTYVVLDSNELDTAHAAAVKLAVESLDWRAAGPSWSERGARGQLADLEQEICPDCRFVITPAGTCNCDE